MARGLKPEPPAAGPPAPRANPLLFGHEPAEAEFAAAAGGGRLHHAWLLTGPAMVGKATLAFRLARRVLALGEAPDDPAGPVFRRIAQGSHADLLTIERAYDDKRRRLRGEITVEQIRAAQRFLHLTPAEGGWRVVVVDGLDALNRNAANALLKLLEEPPARALLLLTSAVPGRLLPTLRSRCRALLLNPLPEAEMQAALAALLPATPAAERATLAAAANGAPGRAVALAQAGALALVRLADDVLAAPPPAIPRRHEIADQVTRAEEGFATFMELLQQGVAAGVAAAARAGAGADAHGRPLEAGSELWQALGRLADETERFNLDKRSAVIVGLELLAAT